MRRIGRWVFLLVFAASAAPAWGETKYSYEGTRDPFFEEGEVPVSENAVQPATESWSLGGILATPGHVQAWVNGKKVSVGDMLGDAQVTAIEPKGVRLKRGGKEGFLTRQGMRWS